LIDESKGRAEAARRHLASTGTFGVLDAAAEAGLLDLPSAIARLRKTSFHATPARRVILNPMPPAPRKPRKKPAPTDDPAFAPAKRKTIPHEFVLDALAPISPTTRPMFSCLAVYSGPRIVFALRDRPNAPADNGVWLATTIENHDSLRREFPQMRSIGVLGKMITGWQILPADAPDFEETALRACELVVAGDPRIGKIPKAKRKRQA